jgi:hypothetical protein
MQFMLYELRKFVSGNNEERNMLDTRRGKGQTRWIKCRPSSNVTENQNEEMISII